MRRREPSRPQLTFPHCVWVKARPRTGELAAREGAAGARWVVQCVSTLSNGRTWIQEQFTTVPLTEWLDVLVFTAPGTTDVRCVYYVQGKINYTGVVWRPVLLVSFEEHEPKEGKIHAAEWPSIRFEEKPRE